MNSAIQSILQLWKSLFSEVCDATKTRHWISKIQSMDVNSLKYKNCGVLWRKKCSQITTSHTSHFTPTTKNASNNWLNWSRLKSSMWIVNYIITSFFLLTTTKCLRPRPRNSLNILGIDVFCSTITNDSTNIDYDQLYGIIHKKHNHRKRRSTRKQIINTNLKRKRIHCSLSSSSFIHAFCQFQFHNRCCHTYVKHCIWCWVHNRP